MVEQVIAAERTRLEACIARRGVRAANVPDVAQRARIKAWLHPNFPVELKEATALLFALAESEARTENTGERRSREDLSNQHEYNEIERYASDEDTEALTLRGDELSRALNALPLIYRQVIERRYHYGESAEEIAAVLGISPENAWQRLSRAHERLRHLLDAFERGDADLSAGTIALLLLLGILNKKVSLAGAFAIDLAPDAWPLRDGSNGAGRAEAKVAVEAKAGRFPWGSVAVCASVAAVLFLMFGVLRLSLSPLTDSATISAEVVPSRPVNEAPPPDAVVSAIPSVTAAPPMPIAPTPSAWPTLHRHVHTYWGDPISQ